METIDPRVFIYNTIKERNPDFTGDVIHVKFKNPFTINNITFDVMNIYQNGYSEVINTRETISFDIEDKNGITTYTTNPFLIFNCGIIYKESLIYKIGPGIIEEHEIPVYNDSKWHLANNSQNNSLLSVALSLYYNKELNAWGFYLKDKKNLYFVQY